MPGAPGPGVRGPDATDSWTKRKGGLLLPNMMGGEQGTCPTLPAHAGSLIIRPSRDIVRKGANISPDACQPHRRSCALISSHIPRQGSDAHTWSVIARFLQRKLGDGSRYRCATPSPVAQILDGRTLP